MVKTATAILVMVVWPVFAADEYAGSQACAGCHPKIFQEYRRTPMGGSMSLPSAIGGLEKPVVVKHPKLPRQYQVYREGGEVYQSEFELNAEGNEVFRSTHKLDYVVGSGVNGFSCIVRRDGYLFQAPLSYYTRGNKWDLSPGYELDDYGFNRPILAACIACHSGRPQAVAGREGLYKDPPFQEAAIGCENCHGPGAQHVSARSKGVTVARGKDKTIVNPALLPARLAEDICMNCHQGGDARVLQPGKDYSDVRPGKWLLETLAVVKLAKKETGREPDLLEHHDAMKSSRCFEASGGKLGCLTCHNPHSGPQPPERAAHYRAKCLTCHADTACKLPAQAREPSNDCAGCHMPQRDSAKISHSALTNHRIAARPHADRPAPGPALDGIILVNPVAGQRQQTLPDLTLLQAYGELMDRQPELQPKYLAVLERLEKQSPDHPMVQAALARKTMADGGPGAQNKAIAHLRKAIELGSSWSLTFQDLADALVRTGQAEEAVRTLEKGIQLSPFTPRLYKMLALQYIHLKRYAEARQTMQRYMELFPEDAFMRGLLKQADSAP
jgi:hypothetical protein